jgi:serine/threonine protein kinase
MRTLEAKICDYGLSVGMSDEGTSGHRLGHAPSYWKAPELCRRPRQPRDCDTFTTKVDVFSYAMVLWEVFHPGTFPWNGDLHPDARLLAGDRPPISPDCPSDWRTLIVACWQQQPELRPYSMDIIRWMDESMDLLLDSDRGRF